MRAILQILSIFLILFFLVSCKQKEEKSDMNIIFLHHSTGGIIWHGTKPSILKKAVRRINSNLGDIIGAKAHLPFLFDRYNKEHNKNYQIKELFYPKPSPYGWNNYPYDYFNIWVKNAGNQSYMEEPTLEMLTKEFQVIVFKHCFPVSNIQENQDSSDINSDLKTLDNYKIQYAAIRDKLHSFPDTKFILFTGPVQVKSQITEDEAKRTKEFVEWLKNEWDLAGDNIYLWDFYFLQTEGGLYFNNEYAVSPDDTHPNKKFASKVVQQLFNRIIDVIENDGSRTELTGEKK